MKIKTILALLAAMCLSWSCFLEKGPDDEFLQSDEIQFKVDGRQLMVYDALTMQKSYNSSTKEFMIMDDKGIQYVLLQCATLPTKVGATVKADLEYSDGGQPQNWYSLEFEVSKTDGEGTWWLWNSKNKIAISVTTLQ